MAPTRRAALVLCGLTLSLSALAGPLPQPQGRINDFAGVLDASVEARLQDIVDALERDTSAEIAVVTVADAGGQSPKQLAGALFNAWGVGKRDKNNGLLLLLALKERRIETEVGYGLEAVLTDPLTVEVLQQKAVPFLKQGNQGEALVAATSRFAELIRRGERAGQVGALVPEREAAPARSARSSSGEAPARRALPASSNALWIGLAIAALAAFGFQVSYRLRRRLPGRGFLGAGLGAVALLAGLRLTGSIPGEAWFLAGGMGLSTLVLGSSLLSHRCPKCGKWMDITTETLRSPTYSSSGEARKTYNCKHCGHHDVKLVTLPRRTRSSSSRSGGSRSGGSRSFGGGRSGGRGGGAGW
jgi:uncharacterized protein